MKTVAVKDRHYGALEAAAARNGRSIQDLLDEAIESWLAEAAAEEAEHEKAGRAVAEAAADEQGGGEPTGQASWAANERALADADKQGGPESDVAPDVHPLDRVCGILDGADMTGLGDGDIDAYIEIVRGR